MACERRRTLKAASRRHFLTLLTGILLFLPRAGLAQGISPIELMQSKAARRIMRGQGEGGRPIKCGFPVLLAYRAEGGVAASGPQRVRPQLENPQTYASPGGSFLLHYTTTGVDAVLAGDVNSNSIPDYIETAAVVLDSVRSGYQQFGWRNPVSDGDEYDVYFEDLEYMPWGPWFGYTEATDPMTTTPYTAASYISLENDYPESVYGHPPQASLRVTVAHEYHHAIQLAYNLPLIEPEVYKYIWFAELSAVYHEDIFYDGINDYYNYLYAFLGAPHSSLTETSGNHMYGAVLWAIYLDEVFGAEANRSLWETMSSNVVTPLEAHRSFLADSGTTLLDSYRNLTIWQLYTGDRAQPEDYFPEGVHYPLVKTDTLSLEPVDVTLPALAGRYYRSPPATTSGGLAMRLHPEQVSAWGVGIVGEASGGTLSDPTTSIMDTSIALYGTSVELYDWGSYSEILHWSFTGDNVDSLGSSLDKTARVETAHSDRLTTQAYASETLTLYQNYPNPFRPAVQSKTYFAFRLQVPASVVLEIRSLSGSLLWSHTLEDVPAGNCFTLDLGVGWDGRDSSGRLVASGVYLMVARAANRTGALKLSVIR